MRDLFHADGPAGGNFRLFCPDEDQLEPSGGTSFAVENRLLDGRRPAQPTITSRRNGRV